MAAALTQFDCCRDGGDAVAHDVNAEIYHPDDPQRSTVSMRLDLHDSGAPATLF